MKRAMTLLASLALLGGATLGLAGCAAAADSDVTLTGGYYAPYPACPETYPDYCDGYWGGWGWGGDHWWRPDQFHHVHHFAHLHGFDHGGSGFGHGGGGGHGR
jgi:hypothetical protein